MDSLPLAPFLDTVTDSLSGDEVVQALAAVMDSETADLLPYIQVVTLLDETGDAPDSVLDAWAIEFNLGEFYDPTFPHATKLYLVRNVFEWKARACTPTVIQDLLTTVFADAQVFEWFMYGGRPFFFKVVTGTGTTDPGLLAKMATLVRALKNVRSWFEGFDVAQQIGGTIYYGQASRQLARQVVPLPASVTQTITQTIYDGVAHINIMRSVIPSS